MTDLPEVAKTACNECPWRRDAMRGHLGPFTAEEWSAIAHSDEPVACHKTIKGNDGWAQPGIRQCAGLATFRTNVFKSPRNPQVATSAEPDHERIFSRSPEFIAHHTIR